MRDRRMAYCRSALVIGVSCLVGCQGLNHPSKPGPSILSGGASTPITAAQEADAQIALGSRAGYLWIPAGIIDSKLATAVGRTLGDAVTTRNWATTLKLHALATGE